MIDICVSTPNGLVRHRYFLFAFQDDCQWRSCQNNGVCVFIKQHYACSCDVPWTGSFCETKIGKFFQCFVSSKEKPRSE